MYSQIIRIREHLLAIRNLIMTIIINDKMRTKFYELCPISNQTNVTYLHKLMFIYSLTSVLHVEQND